MYGVFWCACEDWFQFRNKFFTSKESSTPISGNYPEKPFKKPTEITSTPRLLPLQTTTEQLSPLRTLLIWNEACTTQLLAYPPRFDSLYTTRLRSSVTAHDAERVFSVLTHDTVVRKSRSCFLVPLLSSARTTQHRTANSQCTSPYARFHKKKFPWKIARFAPERVIKTYDNPNTSPITVTFLRKIPPLN